VRLQFALLISTAVASALVATPMTSWAVTVSGEALITRPASLTPSAGGGSATEFGVALPQGSACPGDTAHDGYLVYSYLVPKGVSPASVNFRKGHPDRYYGFIAFGAYYGAINTVQNTGELPPLPYQFSISRWTPSELFSRGSRVANWQGGIACATSGGVVTNYWSAEFVFHASTADPGGYTWRVVQTPPASDHVGLWLGLVLIVVALGCALAVLLSVRRRRPAEKAGSDADVVIDVPQTTGARGS
jgi:hypothetical protein